MNIIYVNNESIIENIKKLEIKCQYFRRFVYHHNEIFVVSHEYGQ